MDGTSHNPVSPGHGGDAGDHLGGASRTDHRNRNSARRVARLLRVAARAVGQRWARRGHRHRYPASQSRGDRGTSDGQAHPDDRRIEHRSRHRGTGGGIRARSQAVLVTLDSNHTHDARVAGAAAVFAVRQRRQLPDGVRYRRRGHAQGACSRIGHGVRATIPRPPCRSSSARRSICRSTGRSRTSCC